MTQNEAREYVRDFLNGMYTDKELANIFEIGECNDLSCCSPYQLEEDLIDTEGKSNGDIGKVCKQCYENLDIGR